MYAAVHFTQKRAFILLFLRRFGLSCHVREGTCIFGGVELFGATYVCNINEHYAVGFQIIGGQT